MGLGLGLGWTSGCAGSARSCMSTRWAKTSTVAPCAIFMSGASRLLWMLGSVCRSVPVGPCSSTATRTGSTARTEHSVKSAVPAASSPLLAAFVVALDAALAVALDAGLGAEALDVALGGALAVGRASRRRLVAAWAAWAAAAALAVALACLVRVGFRVRVKSSGQGSGPGSGSGSG